MQYVQFQDDRATKKVTAQLVTLHQFVGISLLIAWNSLLYSLVIHSLSAKKKKAFEDMKIHLWEVL